MLADVKKTLEDKNNLVQQRVGEKRALENRISELENEVASLADEETTMEKAVWLLQQYADFQQREVIEKVEKIVTSGIRAVFQNESLVFKLYYSETKSGAKKKAPEITMAVFYDYGGEMVKGDIKNSFGGGLSVVVATLLRVVVVMFLKDRVRPILLLDEPLRDLSPSYGSGDVADTYRSRMAEFLLKLTQETDVQIILVTHEPEYGECADVDYRFHGKIGKTPKVVSRSKDPIDNAT